MTGAAADELFAAAGIKFAYLFGSRAAGTHRPESDADIAVIPERPLGLLDEGLLAERLASALAVPSVDLVDLTRAPLLLRGRVVQEGQILYRGDEPARVEFEVRTRTEYLDFLPGQREHRDAFLRRLAAEGLRG